MIGLRTLLKMMGVGKNSDPYFPAIGYEDDIYIVSYPKSGNTWFRFLVSNLLRKQDDPLIDFHECCKYVPDVQVHIEELAAAKRPRFIKSHAPKLDKRYPKVVYLIRDPRDVYVSYYFYLKRKLAPGIGISQFIRELPLGMGRWSDHVREWTNHPRLMCIRYEDLLASPEQCVRDFVEFCDLPVGIGEEKIGDAIARSSFANMQRLEMERGLPLKSNQEPSFEDRFMRSGTTGNWERHLSSDDVQFIEVVEHAMMARFGYECRAS